MKKDVIRSLAVASVLAGSSGCVIVGDIFKAGVWVGVIGIALVLALVAGLVRAFSPKA